MNRKDRIYLSGARLSRLCARLLFFFGIITFWSIVLCNSAAHPEVYRIGRILLPVMGIWLVVIWFLFRKRRDVKRLDQLSAEIHLLYPGASQEEMKELYALRRQRELRSEALGYLLLFALDVGWVLLLRAAGYLDEPWPAEIWGLLSVPLLIAVILLVLSLLPPRQDGDLPAPSDDTVRSTLLTMNRYCISAADGESSVFILSVEKENPAPEEYIRRQRSDARLGILITCLFKGFFIVMPLALIGLAVYAVRIGKAPAVVLLFTGLLALACFILAFFLSCSGRGVESVTGEITRLIRLRSRKCRAYCDRVVSCSQDGYAAQIDLEQAGTVRFPFGADEVSRFCTGPGQEAIIQAYQDRIQSIALLGSGSESGR